MRSTASRQISPRPARILRDLAVPRPAEGEAGAEAVAAVTRELLAA